MVELSLPKLIKFINFILAVVLIVFSFFTVLALGGFNPLRLIMCIYYM